MQIAFVNMLRDQRGLVQPPIDNIDDYWTPQEKRWVGEKLSRSFVGNAATVEQGLREFVRQHQPDELMISGHFFNPQARLNSIRITAEVRERLQGQLA